MKRTWEEVSLRGQRHLVPLAPCAQYQCLPDKIEKSRDLNGSSTVLASSSKYMFDFNSCQVLYCSSQYARTLNLKTRSITEVKSAIVGWDLYFRVRWEPEVSLAYFRGAVVARRSARGRSTSGVSRESKSRRKACFLETVRMSAFSLLLPGIGGIFGRRIMVRVQSSKALLLSFLQRP